MMRANAMRMWYWSKFRRHRGRDVEENDGILHNWKVKGALAGHPMSSSSTSSLFSDSNAVLWYHVLLPDRK